MCDLTLMCFYLGSIHMADWSYRRYTTNASAWSALLLAATLGVSTDPVRSPDSYFARSLPRVHIIRSRQDMLGTPKVRHIAASDDGTMSLC
jgi:hypothetical protein